MILDFNAKELNAMLDSNEEVRHFVSNGTWGDTLEIYVDGKRHSSLKFKGFDLYKESYDSLFRRVRTVLLPF